MRRWFLWVLASCAVALPLSLADDGGVAAPPAPAVPAAPPAPMLDAVKALAAKCVYEPAAFEMTVGPPIRFGEKVVVEMLTFRSPVTSVDPEKNDIVKAKLFRTDKPEPALVVMFGGWRFDPATPKLAARLAEETNLQTLFVDLPFQGLRTPKDRKPGELTFSADLAQNEATFVQAAQDVGRVLDWLVRERKVDPKRLGVLGTSLGGYVACDLYGMTDRFSCCVGLITGGDVASVIFNGNRLTSKIRADLLAAGLEESGVRERMRPLDPSTWARKERKDGLLLIAAEEDEIVRLDTVRALAEAYGGAHLVVMEKSGHINPQALDDHFGEAVRHFSDRLLPKPATVPAAK